MSADDEDDEEYGTLKPSSWFWWKDKGLSDIPCARNSLMYAILGGLGTGLTTFMMTSHIPKTTNYSVFSFMGISCVYYFYCNINRINEKHRLAVMRVELQKYIEAEGTAVDPFIRNPAPGESSKP